MNKKYVLILLLVIIVGFGATLFSKTDMFQGKFTMRQAPNLHPYNWFGQFVTPVASPVPTIIVSEVPSDVPSEVPSTGGPSIVVSKVTSLVASVVVSAVTSPVALRAEDAAKVDPKKVKKLTKKILDDFAKKDFKKNPEKYSLSWAEKDRLIEIYKKKSTK